MTEDELITLEEMEMEKIQEENGNNIITYLQHDISIPYLINFSEMLYDIARDDKDCDDMDYFGDSDIKYKDILPDVYNSSKNFKELVKSDILAIHVDNIKNEIEPSDLESNFNFKSSFNISRYLVEKKINPYVIASGLIIESEIMTSDLNDNNFESQAEKMSMIYKIDDYDYFLGCIIGSIDDIADLVRDVKINMIIKV